MLIYEIKTKMAETIWCHCSPAFVGLYLP